MSNPDGDSYKLGQNSTSDCRSSLTEEALSLTTGPTLENDSSEQDFTIELDCLLQRLGEAQKHYPTTGHQIVRGLQSQTATNAVPATVCVELEEAHQTIHRLGHERQIHRANTLRQQRDVETYREEVNRLKRRATDLQQQVTRLDSQLRTVQQVSQARVNQIDDLTVELMGLRRFVRALPPNFAQAYGTIEENPKMAREVYTLLHLVPDRRFEEAFNDKMNAICYRKRYLAARAMYAGAAQWAEERLMEAEDTWLRDRSTEAGRTLQQIDQLTSRAKALACGSRYAPGGVGHGLLGFPFELPFSPTSPQDDYIKSLIYRFKNPDALMLLRDGMLRLSSRLKHTQDCGLRSLYNEFMVCGRHVPNAKTRLSMQKAFERHLEKLQLAHRDLLFSLVGQVNKAVITIVEQEKGVKVDVGDVVGKADRRCTRDVACSAQDTTVSDFRLHKAEESLRLDRLRHLDRESEFMKALAAERANVAEMRQAACGVLDHLLSVDRAVIAALHLGAAKKRKWDAGSALGDPFHSIANRPKETAFDNPRFVTMVGDSADLLVSYIRQWGLSHTAEKEEKKQSPETLPPVPGLITGTANFHQCSGENSSPLVNIRRRVKKSVSSSNNTSSTLDANCLPRQPLPNTRRATVPAPKAPAAARRTGNVPPAVRRTIPLVTI